MSRSGITVVRKGGKGQQQQQSTHTPVEAPNTLRSDSTARVLEVLSEGPIKGYHTGDLQSVFLDKTPILNSDGSANFNVLQTDFRYGVPDQDPISGFSSAEASYSVGAQVKYGAPIVRRVSDNLSALRVTVRIPALFVQQQSGDVDATAVDWQVDYRVNGGAWITAFVDHVEGKTMSGYERSVRFNLPPGSANVDVRMVRPTPDATDSQISNATYFASYTEIVDVNLKYDDTAVVAMVIDSQYFPNIPNRGFLLDGLLWQIPDNYNPYTRTYTGDWGGTFKADWTNNPAWVLYGFLTNERFGIGRDIDAPAVDKWSFYEAARYNDEQVPDGKGGTGTEPRFTCNTVINTRQEAFVVLTAIASSMRAVLYWSNGTIFLVQDRPQPDPARLFSPANVESGIFDYAGTDYRSKCTVVPVTWNDPEQDYEPQVELVQDAELMSQQGYRENPQTAFGCTSRGQAIRFGRWYIYTTQYETELVTFRTGLENADVRPGDMILINDPSRAGARLGGRLLDDTSLDTLTLDKLDPNIVPGWTIYVTVEKAVFEMTVIGLTGDGRVNVTGKPVPPPPPGSMWLGASSSVEPTTWRVAALRDLGQWKYEILASQYDAGKYSYVDYNVRIPPPSFSLVPSGPLRNGHDIAVREYIYLDTAGTPQFGVVMSWQPSSDPRVAFYNVELIGPNGDYRRYTHQVVVTLDIHPMRQGSWQILLTAEDNIGRRSVPLTFGFTTIGLSEKPLPPTGLYAAAEGATLHLMWVPTNEIDVVYFWIAWHPSIDASATWQRATTVAARIPRAQTQISVPLRPGTYFIKAVDSLGQQSDEAARAVVFNQMVPGNVIADLIEQPAWSGARNLWTTVAGELMLSPPTAPEPVPPEAWPGLRGVTINATPTRYSYYDFSGSLDMGEVGDCLLTATVVAHGGTGVTMHTWLPLASARPLAMGDSDQWDASIEISASDDGINWRNWAPVQASMIHARAFRARMLGLIYDLQTSIRASRCELRIDVPDRTERGTAIAIDGGGHATATYAVPFHETPTLQLTGYVPGSVGAGLVILSSDKYGFTIEQRRDSGAAVAGGRFDWVALGFGVSA